jgi:hypothetical protein
VKLPKFHSDVVNGIVVLECLSVVNNITLVAWNFFIEGLHMAFGDVFHMDDSRHERHTDPSRKQIPNQIISTASVDISSQKMLAEDNGRQKGYYRVGRLRALYEVPHRLFSQM